MSEEQPTYLTVAGTRYVICRVCGERADRTIDGLCERCYARSQEVPPDYREKSDLLIAQAPLAQHYKGLAIEPIQYIEANHLGFHEGNVVKYVSRWRQKDGLADLKKAKFYIERLIELAESEHKA